MKLPTDRPNDSHLIVGDCNRRTGDATWSIHLHAFIACEIHASQDTIRLIRKRCVKEREEWLAIKKSIRGPEARLAKTWERRWLRRERAATLLANYNDGHKPEELQTYYWPCELAPALEYVISEIYLTAKQEA